MRCLATLRRAPVRAALATSLCVAAGVAALSAPAVADTSAQADAKVRQLLTAVQGVQRQVAQAERDYDAALAGVAASVNGAILSGQASDADAALAAQARQQLDDRVRGLYMSGGPLAIYATLLDAQDPSALQEQALVVSHVVAADQVTVAAVDRVSAQAAQVADTAQRLARTHIRTERSVALAASRVFGLLAREQALLTQAQSHAAVVRAAEQALAAQRAALAQITASQLSRLHAMPASPAYMALYRKAVAAECPGLSWTVVAAIGQVESGHGRDVSTSYAGAMGPMQFMPATFDHYAVDGDHDGTTDIMSAPDSIYTAARYLCANGAAHGPNALANAIYLYNHADWYVQMVLTLAKQYAGGS